MKDFRGNKFFDLQEIIPKNRQGEDGAFEVSSAYLNSHMERIENLNKLLRLPDVGEIFFMHTEKSFNAFTFIPWLSERYFIEEICASTYSISRRVVEALCELQNMGRVGQVVLLISDSMVKRNAATIDVLDGLVKHHANFQVKYYWNHSKICLLKTSEHHLILEGSGNWSENALLEQYVLAIDKAIYDFRRSIFE